MIGVTEKFIRTVDYDDCTDPEDCLECVNTCPNYCWAYYQIKTPEVGQEPEGYRIIPTWKILCVGCESCVEACPEGAIEISTP